MNSWLKMFSTFGNTSRTPIATDEGRGDQQFHPDRMQRQAEAPLDRQAGQCEQRQPLRGDDAIEQGRTDRFAWWKSGRSISARRS